jgi:hypothetical protein
MKIARIILFLILSVLALVAAQESEVYERAAEEDTAEEVTPEEVEEINCDEICASLVAEATRLANQEMAILEGRLSPLKAALEQAKDSSVAAASEVATLKGQLASMERVVAAAKAEAQAISASAAETESIANAKLTEMEAEVSAANARVAEFENMPFFINKPKIMSAIMALLRKFGLVKRKASESEL